MNRTDSVDVALGERRLVGLLLDHVVVEHQRQRRVAGLVPSPLESVRVARLAAHVVAVGQAEVVVEAVVGREELRLVAAVPLADHLRAVAGVGEQSAPG